MACQKIDEFVEKQTREDQLRSERSKFTAGCKTVTNRTVINNKEVEEERRRLKSEEIKELGNTAFRSGKFQEAEEYYSSALMQYDKVKSFSMPINLVMKADKQINILTTNVKFVFLNIWDTKTL